MIYKSFISYSHAADDRLAPALQSALYRFAKPWYRMRAMRIFRDKTSLSANPALWRTIEKALDESEWFLLMASPQAAQSQWVGQEIAWWLTHRSADRMLILLTEGELAWDSVAADFDWSRTTALSRTLQRKFVGEPLYVDLRWAKTTETLSLRHSQFRGAILNIAAPLLGREKDELDGEDVRQHRRTRRVAWGVAVALLALTVSAVTAAYLAIQQSGIARSRELATSATAQLPFDPELSALLATEGARISPTIQSESALRVSLLESHVRTAMRGHTGGVWSVAYSPDGEHVATASEDRTVRVWDSATGASIAELHGHTERVHSLAFSADGRFVITASDDRSVRLWDVATARSIARFEGHRGLVGGDSFSPDSRLLVLARDDDTAVVWEIAAGRTVAELRGHGGAVGTAAFSPDGTLILTGSDDTTARVWDVRTGTTIAELRDQSTPVTRAFFSPDGRLAATIAPDERIVHIWQAGTWKAVATVTVDAGIVDAVFSPDGRRLAVVEDLGNHLRLWDTATGEVAAGLTGHVERIFHVAFSPDGTYVVTASADKTARVWDSATGTLVVELRGHQGIVTSAQFSPQGNRVATSSLDATARIWEGVPLEGEGGVELRGHCPQIGSAHFSRDGAMVVTAGSDDEVSIWSVDGGRRTLELPRLAETISAVAFSPDRRFLVTASYKGVARVWEVATGRLIAELRRHDGAVTGVAFSPDGTLLALDREGIVGGNGPNFRKALAEFDAYVVANQPLIPNYGERWRNEEAIATGFVESAVNQVVSKRFVKKQQMQWTKKGAHLLLQTRTRVLDERLEETFRDWYPGFRPAENEAQKAA